jgi:hypothetical protein
MVAVTSTGSALGDYEQLTSFDAERAAEHTPLGLVMNPGLREAMKLFSVVATEPLAPLRCFVRTKDAASPDLFADDEPVSKGARAHVALLLNYVGVFRFLSSSYHEPEFDADRIEVEPVEGSSDAVTTVYDISRRLGLPVRDVVTAAGMSKSTFYTWTAPDAPKPRVASQARLWQLAQFVEDIEAVLGRSARRWLLADERRFERLGKGDFDELLGELNARPPSLEFPPTYAEAYAVGGDRLVADDAEAAPTRQRRGRAEVAKAANRSRRATS